MKKFSRSLLLQTFDRKLAEIIQVDLPVLKEIRKFVITSGGKRIRPLFHYFLVNMNNYKGKLWIDSGAIAELIHAASLLHDDVIDNAEIRRGKYTIGKLYGNKVAILSGDYLLTSAIDHLSKMGNIPILNLFNHTIRELTKSELIQMEWEKNPKISMNTYKKIIYGKTASLFGAVAESAGILCNLEKNDLKKIRDFGVGIGMLFQMKDDYIDYFLPASTSGKIENKDFLNGLLTYPAIVLRDYLDNHEKKIYLAMFAKPERNEEDIKIIHDFYKKYRVREKILQKMKKEAYSLVAYLNSYAESDIRQIMINQIEKLSGETV